MNIVRKIFEESETAELASELADELSPPLTVALCGQLGAGKTTFLRYFVKSRGISDPVSSPSFVLQHIYTGTQLTIEHWDLYRLKIAPEDLFEPPEENTIRFIEWADRFPEVMKATDLTINIKLKKINSDRFSREFYIESPGRV
ncbi:MAG: tRNA (adenosine(37)-N6)-threonylcarbamoyltransferase complex ATPase subunit type 1 TsaE [Candidatus Dadabacteria bacterium]|nr:MAG: tRNA (adenosine(37)-N6)-threonylcarbamoyltransferase complex ATPase subunit type 1 TsaE [Candidatus Dadabacteria bacterium]